MALIAEVTLIAGAVPLPAVVLEQLTDPVPDGPAPCSGNDAVSVVPELMPACRS